MDEVAEQKQVGHGKAVFRIRDILVRTRILGSAHLIYGSGSKMQTKNKFFFLFVLLITFCGYIYISLQR
jgi:hypothetical protein